MHRRIPEQVVEGKRLGRHVHHDPRSLRYPFKAAIALTSRRWSADGDTVLDQGNLGSCTGNATVGAMICSQGPLNAALSIAQKATLNEQLAVKVYERATTTDPSPGSYPPDDTGSDGLDAAKAAKSFGYISGYTHALSLDDALAALTLGPVIIGVDWYEGFDNPSTSGLVSISGQVRGGHEICLDEIDATSKHVWLRNSWSSSWGVQGRACMTFTTLGDLLANQGDATVLTPLSVPAPTPVPASPDQALADATATWVEHHKLSASNEETRQALLTWRTAKGL